MMDPRSPAPATDRAAPAPQSPCERFDDRHYRLSDKLYGDLKERAGEMAKLYRRRPAATLRASGSAPLGVCAYFDATLARRARGARC
jgi:hypothetical protein